MTAKKIDTTEFEQLMEALRMIRELGEGEYSGKLGGNLSIIVPVRQRAAFVKLAANVIWILGMSIESAEAPRA